MEEQIDVSVVIITYNHEKYIERAINSVLMQECNANIEILIGDDCSTDTTSQKIRDLAEGHENIKFFIREKNLKASSNLFELFQRAQGKYIATLEGDDYWIKKDKLQIQLNFLKDNPQYIGCAHECLLVNEDGTAQRNQKLEWIASKREYTLERNKGFYLCGQLGTLFFHNIFLNPQFEYSIIKDANEMISDRTLLLVLTLHGPMYRMEDIMSAYRQISDKTAQNATSKYFEQNKHSAYENFELTQKLENYAKENSEKRIKFDYIKKLFFTSMVWNFIKTRDTDLKEDIYKVLNQSRLSCFGYFLFLPRGIIHKLRNKRR